MTYPVGTIRVVKAINREVGFYGYRIRETVTPSGLYIEWEELFSTEEAARIFLANWRARR